MARKKVFVSAGHGGSEPGAVANGFMEKDLNLAIALACRDELVRHNVDVRMSRTKDEEDGLREEIKECNAYGPDLAVSIHNNAGGGDGTEVFHAVNGGTGKTLAKNILAEIVATGQNSRGIKTRKDTDGTDWYGFIRETNAPAVIVECAFMDNKADLASIDTAEEQTAMGVAIAKGILKTLDVKYKAEEPKKDEPATKPATDDVTVTLPVLKKGSKGDEVKALQAMLKGLGYGLGIWGIDGNFGAQTDKVVRQYQKKATLEADGIVGDATWRSLLGI